jgi:hypothetical protein
MSILLREDSLGEVSGPVGITSYEPTPRHVHLNCSRDLIGSLLRGEGLQSWLDSEPGRQTA